MAKTTEIRPKISIEETITHRYVIALTQQQLLDVLSGRAEISMWALPPPDADVETDEEGVLIIRWETTVTKNREE